MDEGIRAKLLEILDQILEQANKVKETEEVKVELGYVEGLGNLRGKAVNTTNYALWRLTGEVFIRTAVGEDSQYFKDFLEIQSAQQIVFNSRNVDAGVVILRKLKDAIEQDAL